MINPATEMVAFARAALVDPVPRDDRQTPKQLRRRRIVAVVTALAGTSLLALTLRVPAGDPTFYLLTAAVALVWTVGAFASGPLHLGHAWTRDGGIGRPVVQSLALAVLLIALFLAGSVVVAQIPVLRGPLDILLDHARLGSIPLVAVLTVLNGIGEELFYRGALFAAVGRHRAVAATTLVYAIATIPTGVPLLVLAAAIVGLVCGLQRRVTGGVLGPILVHNAWSLTMLLILPSVLDTLR